MWASIVVPLARLLADRESLDDFPESIIRTTVSPVLRDDLDPLDSLIILRGATFMHPTIFLICYFAVATVLIFRWG